MVHSFCIVALFCLLLPAMGKPGSELRDPQLGDDLPWFIQIQDNQELTDKQKAMQLLYKLYKQDNDIVPEEPGRTREVEENEKEGGLERRASPQVRRAGCRIFFWKSWTAC
ncbi:somatostatin-like [Hippocampus comes]|uniref:somatostatin-like n=1 Tax=Hippocampus comes TaxID=109280 RepID=UPI00094EFB3B|nr:PREDICTED: somatostatin-like [Hippocampus comes]